MEKSRKRLRVCLFCVVLTAVLIGMIYYFGDVRNPGNIERGVLIRNPGHRWERTWL